MHNVDNQAVEWVPDSYWEPSRKFEQSMLGDAEQQLQGNIKYLFQVLTLSLCHKNCISIIKDSGMENFFEIYAYLFYLSTVKSISNNPPLGLVSFLICKMLQWIYHAKKPLAICVSAVQFLIDMVSNYKDKNMSHCIRKLTKCLGENKGADQLRGKREADQRLCFRCTDSTILLLLKSKISSFCDCKGWFVSDLVRTHIVGFLTQRLISFDTAQAMYV